MRLFLLGIMVTAGFFNTAFARVDVLRSSATETYECYYNSGSPEKRIKTSVKYYIVSQSDSNTIDYITVSYARVYFTCLQAPYSRAGYYKVYWISRTDSVPAGGPRFVSTNQVAIFLNEVLSEVDGSWDRWGTGAAWTRFLITDGGRILGGKSEGSWFSVFDQDPLSGSSYGFTETVRLDEGFTPDKALTDKANAYSYTPGQPAGTLENGMKAVFQLLEKKGYLDWYKVECR